MEYSHRVLSLILTNMFLHAFSLLQIVQPEEVANKTGLSYPHNTHCLANGEVMISSLGKPNGEGEGMDLYILWQC